MSDTSSIPPDRPGAEDALAEVDKLATTEGEDHEERLGALERLHSELERELDERDPESRTSE